MNPVPTAQKLLRVAFAALFGVMSLAHGPVMAAAHAAPVPVSVDAQPMAAMHHGGGHHAMGHAADPMMRAMDESGAPASAPATCNSFACFLAVASPPVMTPTASLILIGQLAAHPPYAGSPAALEPADPPPRLQA